MLDSRGGRAFGGAMAKLPNVFTKQTVQSLKEWTNGNPPVKISGEDLKQSLKACSLVKNIKI